MLLCYHHTWSPNALAHPIDLLAQGVFDRAGIVLLNGHVHMHAAAFGKPCRLSSQTT
jgi:hypothetical protein